MMRLFAAALLVAAATSQEHTEGALLNTASTTNLPPFNAIDVGYRGCMPLSVSVKSGPSYGFAIDGASVKAPGFQDVSGVALTLTVPDDTIRSLTVGGSANVYFSVQPAANFAVSSYGSGWVKLEPGQSFQDGNVHVYMAGGNSVALCPQQFATASSLDVHNSGTGSVVIDNVNAGNSNVELSGTGPISISASAAPRSSGHVSLSGSSSITMGAEQVSVDLRGMGDVYINGAKNVRGSLSGIGHVHVPVDASCFLAQSGMGGCDQNLSPPYPPASCDSFGPQGIVNANAVHWTVSVHGNSCSSSSWIKGVRMSSSDTEMDGAVVQQAESSHGHRLPDACCTTGFSYTGTHCTTHGEHHRCCVEGGQWTCAKGSIFDAVSRSFGSAVAAVGRLADKE